MARGHRLNTSIVLAAVHGLSGLFRAVSEVEPSLFRPLHPLSPSLISHLASVDVNQNGPFRVTRNKSTVSLLERREKRVLKATTKLTVFCFVFVFAIVLKAKQCITSYVISK